MHLSGHGVETRAGIGLHVLHGFLEPAHGGIEAAYIVAGLLDQGLHDSVVLSHLGLQIFLSLKERGDVALEFDEFASDGLGGARTDGATGDESGESGSAEDGNVTVTHGETSSGLRVRRSSSQNHLTATLVLPGWGRRARCKFHFIVRAAVGKG